MKWSWRRSRRWSSRTSHCLKLTSVVTCTWQKHNPTRRHSVERMLPPTKVFPRRTVNKTILKPCLTASTGRANTHMWDFPDVIKFRVVAHTISEKKIQFQHPDYNPDRAQKLISSSMSRHLSTRNISSKSMHAILSNLANRQTAAGKRTYLLLCRT